MNIFESISKVMADIGAVGKDSKNQMQGFMYRGIDAVMNAINPALVKNKVFVVPEVIEQTREERVNSKGTCLIYSICKVRYTFYAEDGSFVQATTIGEGMDSGDKATNKAMSIAFKYACFQVFCIPTGEMVDPAAECHEVKSKAAKKSEPKEEPKPVVSNFITPEQKAQILAELNRTGVTPTQVTELVNAKSIDEIPSSAFDSLYKKLLKTPSI